MKTITLNVQIEIRIPEFDDDGEPLTKVDEDLFGPEVTKLTVDGVDKLTNGSISMGTKFRWELLSE